MAWTLEDEIAWTERNPFRMHLGVAIERVSTDGSGDCEIALEINDNLVQAYGMVHGGIYCTLIDTVLGTAVRSAYQHDIGPLTIDLNVSFLRPAGKGRIYSSASSSRRAARSWSASPTCSTPNGASWPPVAALSPCAISRVTAPTRARRSMQAHPKAS